MVKKLLLGCGLPTLLIIVIAVSIGRHLIKPAPKTERSETAQMGDVEVKVVETGTIEPLHKVEVKSKVGGRVTKLYVDAGASVKQGQVLATIDPQEINSQVAALRAQLSGAQARLEAARKNAIYQQSQTGTNIDQYVQNVQVAKARLNQLETESGVQPKLTQQSIDSAQANLDAAKANLKVQEDSLTLLTESTHPQAVVSTQAAYDTAKAQYENDKRNVTRQEQLLSKGFVSQQAVDSAVTQAEASKAHLSETREKLDRIKQANALEEANARSQVAAARSQVQQAQAALAQAQTNVLPITKRQELESARASYAQAKAQLAAARSGRTQDLMRRDEAASSAAEVQQIQNQLKQLLVRQNDTTLVASMPGVVTKRYVEEGELITSGIESFSSGTPVYQVSDLSTMLVKINVNEVDIAKLHPGISTEVTIDASRGVTFNGRVSKVSPSALSDSSSSSSGGGGASSGSSQTVIRFPVEIRIDHADPRLKPGMSAHCAIIVARHKNVLRVPINCVQGTGEKGTVQIVTSVTKDGQVTETTTPREVKVGLRGDEFAEILSGLKAGEKVRPAAYTGPPRKTIEMHGGPG